MTKVQGKSIYFPRLNILNILILTKLFRGQNRNGTCYSSSECGDKGGSSKGSCAAGYVCCIILRTLIWGILWGSYSTKMSIHLLSIRFGVCCVFIYNDGVTKEVSQNNTYIQNTGYPTADTSTDASITYTVKKCSDGKYMQQNDHEVNIYA